MRRLYDFLLQLYPRKHRELFGGEMARVFEAAAEERRAQGRAAYAGFVPREAIGLVRGAAGAWLGRKPEAAAAPAGVPAGPRSDIAEAQRCVDASIAGMVHAIARHEFEKARFYSLAERKLSEKLRRLKEAHGIND